jgi:tetratricopeptide (TPR) repeat protein
MYSAALTIVLAVVAADPAVEAEAKKYFEAGQTNYKLGRFEEALVDYQRAYELIPYADLLFNMGQCERNLKRYDRALFFFKGYVKDTPREEDKQRVRLLITQLEEEKARAETARTASTAPPAPQLVEQPLIQREEEEGGSVLGEWWFWTILGVVAAGTAGAVIIATSSDPADPMGSIGTIRGNGL